MTIRKNKYFASLSLLIILLSQLSCKKDCLEKEKCTPSTYVSTYVIEQTTPAATGNTYFIDAEEGKKGNDGKSTDNPFKEIENLEEVELQAGDQILFKRGQYHFGDLRIEASGTETDRIYIADYGSGDLPLIKSKDKKDGKALYLFNADYVTIQNLNIQGGTNAILLEGSDYAIIQGCRIGEESESGIRATGRYSETTGSNYGIVRHCLIYSGLEGDLGDLQGTDGIQLMDGASNWLVSKNEFKAWGHSALNIKPIYTTLNSNNNLIEGNLFDCSDIDYMRALDITGPENRATNNVFQKNIIKNQTVTSHLHGNGNTVAYNLFIGLKTTAASTQPWAIDFHVFIGNSGGVDRNEYVCFDNKVYNNVFYNFQDGVGIRSLDSKSGTLNAVHDNEVVNNIFYNVGTALEIDEEPTAMKVTNNLFYSTGPSTAFKFENASYNFATFTALSGVDGFLIENNLDANPLFVNPGANDFMLTLGSVAIDAGLDVGLSSDFAGGSLVGVPDIGAFEY
ncbi:MAG: hypothetical protein GQ574_23050 [Crocinitomix sp.]|nr:hypothetical protein [Crocinitomix sp.]